MKSDKIDKPRKQVSKQCLPNLPNTKITVAPIIIISEERLACISVQGDFTLFYQRQNLVTTKM